jgi:hypothetical protein
MGHLLEAIKKLEQQRAAVRPKPDRRTPAEPAAKIWRIDAPHAVSPAHRNAEPHQAGSSDRGTAARKGDEIERVDVAQALPDPELAHPIAAAPDAGPTAGGGERAAAKVGWQFATPAIPSDYYDLAARLVKPVSGSEGPQTVLLTAVSNAALDAVSLAALAVILSAQGNVLWVDTRNIRPAADAVGPAAGQYAGWHELRAGKVTWDEIVAPTNLAGVSFVGCGDRPLRTDVVAFGRHFFEPLRSTFSFVLIGGGLAEESAYFAPVCGAIGLVTAIGNATRSQIGCALRTLDAAGGCEPLMIAVEPHRP